jgi:hypothetical protein
MKQFTSHIDFSLTKKRFEMMIKEFSALRSGTKGLFLIPVLLAITMMFCTTSTDNEPKDITGNTESYIYSVDLYVNPSNPSIDNSRGFDIRFDSDGNPFTGTQEIRFAETGKLRFKQIYNDGHIVESIQYNVQEDIMVVNKYEYEGARVNVREMYDENNRLMSQWMSLDSEDSLQTGKYWHPNGQLRFEFSFKDEMIYHGLMTLYDENGEILEQELYEDGELVEKIK